MSGNALADAFTNANKPTVAIQSPFEVMNQAGSVAEKINANRLFQAQALRGQLLQQSTDANGNVDMPTYNRLAAGAGPGLAPAAAAGLDQSTRIAGEQQAQGGIRNAYLGQQLGALLDLPDEQLNHGLAATAGRIRDSRLFPPGEIDTVLSHLPSDPAALRTQLRQVQLSLQASGAQQGQTYGTAGTQTGPGGVTIGTVQQSPARGGGVSAVPQQGAPQGPDAGTLSGVSTITDGQGVPHQDTLAGHIQAGRVTPMGTPAPGYSAAPAPAGVARPGPAAGGNYSTQPLLGGAKTPVPGSADPGVLTSPDMGGQTEGPPGSRPTPVTGPRSGGTAGPRPGVVDAVKMDQEAFGKARTAQPQLQAQDQNLQHAYDALKLISTGKTTETLSAMRNVLAANGMLPNKAVNDQVLYEIFNKYTERTIAAAGNAGGTDTARAMAAGSNPGTPLLSASNLAFLRNDIGKNRQAMLPLLTAPDTTTGNGFGNHAAGMSDPTKIDYRGLNWSQYSKKEQDEITKSVGPVGSPREMALQRAKGMGAHFWPETAAVSAVPH